LQAVAAADHRTKEKRMSRIILRTTLLGTVPAVLVGLLVAPPAQAGNAGSTPRPERPTPGFHPHPARLHNDPALVLGEIGGSTRDGDGVLGTATAALGGYPQEFHVYRVGARTRLLSRQTGVLYELRQAGTEWELEHLVTGERIRSPQLLDLSFRPGSPSHDGLRDEDGHSAGQLQARWARQGFEPAAIMDVVKRLFRSQTIRNQSRNPVPPAAIRMRALLDGDPNASVLFAAGINRADQIVFQLSALRPYQLTWQPARPALGQPAQWRLVGAWTGGGREVIELSRLTHVGVEWD
jgi:hypothetical protein